MQISGFGDLRVFPVAPDVISQERLSRSEAEILWSIFTLVVVWVSASPPVLVVLEHTDCRCCSVHHELDTGHLAECIAEALSNPGGHVLCHLVWAGILHMLTSLIVASDHTAVLFAP